MHPAVSVVIPAHQRLRELTYAVESILAQTVPVAEVLIVDDGSTGELPERLPGMIAERANWRERVKYIYQENQGQSAARNNGIRHATGEWIAFNDSDDLWLPQKVEWQLRALERFGGECGLCFTDAWFMNNPRMKMTLFQLAEAHYDERLGKVEDVVHFIEHVFQVWVQTVVVRTEVARQVMFDEQLRYQEDLDFMFRIAHVTRCCYVNMPMVLIDRSPAETRHRGGARDWHKEEFRLRMMQRRHEKHLEQERGLDPKIEQLVKHQLSDVHSSWASAYLKSGDYAKARRSAAKALAFEKSPRTAIRWALINGAPGLVQKALLARDRKKTQNEDSPDPHG